ncbi:MAG: hypothetical protein ACXWW4_05150 [Candidatus Binatia bacterium]
MTKTFVTIGKTATESIDTDQPVWVLLPETIQPAVVSTYSRQLHAGLKVLVRLGSAKNIIEAHWLPQLHAANEQSDDAKSQQIAALRHHVAALAGDARKRAQIFLSCLSKLRLIRPPLYPILEKLRETAPLTDKDLTPLVNALCAALRKSGDVPSGHKQKLRTYIHSGAYDSETMLWLALCVDPLFALHLWHDSLANQLPNRAEEDRSRDQDALERGLQRAVEHIRAGTPCDDRVCRTDWHAWLADLVGCEPQARFFAAIGAIHQGLNKSACLNFDRSKSFHDFGETAPRFLTLDKLSRAVTAFDRTLSHLAVVFADDDTEMKQLCQGHLVHSGLLIRGLVGESEAIKTLYPFHAMAIPNQPELSDRLIAKVRAACEDGSLAHTCAARYAMRADDLGKGIVKAISIQKQLLQLVPIEVHRLADAIETRVRLRKIAESLTSPNHRQQAFTIEAAIRAHTMRQQQLGKSLKADFRIDPSRLFSLDNFLIDRIKAHFGNELEFMRTVLAPYFERNQAAKQYQSATASPGMAINS